MRATTRSSKTLLLFFSCLLLAQVAVYAQQPDTARIRQLRMAAGAAFHSGQFEKNVLLTDSLADTYAEGGDFTGYAIFSMYNGWTHLNELKDYERAAFYADRALRTVREKLGGELPYLYDLYSLLAGIYAGVGNPEKALEYNHLALQTVADMGRAGSFGDYVVHSNLGSTYMEIGQYSEALPFLNNARKILLRVGDEQGRDARFYFNAAQLQAHISQCYLNLNELEKALAEALAGLPYVQEDNRPEHFDYHEIYLALADAYSRNGRAQQAQEYHWILEKIYRDNFGEQSTQMAALFRHEAEHAAREGDLAAALQLNGQAMEMAGLRVADDGLGLLGPDGQLRCPACMPDLLDQRVRFLWQSGQKSGKKETYLKACLATANLALESLTELRQTLLFREGSKQVLFERFQNMLKRGSLAAQQLYENLGAPAYLEQAFRLGEHSRANVLLEALVQARAEAYAGLPPEALERERHLSLELVRQERLVEDARAERDTLRMAQIQNGPLFEGKQRYEAFLQQLQAEYPRYFAARHQVSIPTLPDIQQALGPDDLMVSYLLDKEDGLLQIFTLSAHGATLTSQPWQPAYEQTIEEYRDALQQVSLIQTPKRRAFIRQSHQLYRLLIEPVEEQIKGKKRLLVVADDCLHYLPFETLVARETDAAFPELDFLIKNMAVSYQYSGAVFLESRHKAGPVTERLLAFAPVFEEGQTTAQLADGYRSMLESSISAIREGRFSPLPWSEKEVQDIEALFAPGNAKILLRQAANERALKSEMERGCRFLHLATHSFANRRNPRFSGIACAQTEGVEDGILYTGEIYRQTVKADLVVLSSCESGVGQLASGEGMLGLNRSFIYAGVPNVLYSLWRVDDRRSGELMAAFYRSVLAGQPYPEALRQAKLSLLENSQTALPVYWSAFTLIGR